MDRKDYGCFVSPGFPCASSPGSTEGAEIMYKCPLCDCFYLKRKGLKKHFKIWHLKLKMTNAKAKEILIFSGAGNTEREIVRAALSYSPYPNQNNLGYRHRAEDYLEKYCRVDV